jgi:hypothetical protein
MADGTSKDLRVGYENSALAGIINYTVAVCIFSLPKLCHPAGIYFIFRLVSYGSIDPCGMTKSLNN